MSFFNLLVYVREGAIISYYYYRYSINATAVVISIIEYLIYTTFFLVDISNLLNISTMKSRSSIFISLI